jgi:hypothetical protein
MSLLQVHNEIVSQLQIERQKINLGTLTYYVNTSIASAN